MKYEVKKGGKVYMSTDHKSCQYPPEVELSIQNAGYSIYIDGKKQPRRKLPDTKTTQGRKNRKGD